MTFDATDMENHALQAAHAPGVPRRIGPAPLDVPTALYGLFMLMVVVDIGGAFGLKYGAFILVVFYLTLAGLGLGASVPLYFVVVEGFLFVVAPAFFLLLAVTVFTVSPSVAIGRLTSFGIWLLYPVLLRVRPRERIVTVFAHVMLLGALLVLIMFCLLTRLYQLNRFDLINAINTFTESHRLGYFGQKPLTDEVNVFFPGVYFRWSLLLIPAAILAFRKSGARFMTTVAAALATASTAVFGALVVGIGWAVLDSGLSRTERRIYLRRAALLAIALGLLAYALYHAGFSGVVQLVVGKFSAGSASTAMKVGHIESIINEVSQSVGRMLFGMGVGSSFYSLGPGETVTEVEVSHFDLVRQFGTVYAIAFFAYVGWLAWAVRRVDRTGTLLAIGLVLLFIASGTNPLLLSPVFFVPLVISRAYLTMAAKEQASDYVARLQPARG